MTENIVSLRTARAEPVTLEHAGPREIDGRAALISFWRAFRRRQWIVVGIVIACLVVGVIATLLATREYSATASLEISRQDPNVINVEGVETVDATQNLEFYQTQYKLLEARSLAERVARRLQLASKDGFFESLGEDPDDFGSLNSGRGRNVFSSRNERFRKAVDLLQDNVSISPLHGSALVDIRFTSASPELSSQIANAWADEFIKANLDRRFAATVEARKFLEQKLSELRGQLEQSERAMINYASDKGIVTLGVGQQPDGTVRQGRTLAESDLESLNNALSQATADRIAAESRLAVNGKGGATDEALANPALNTMRQKRAELAATYAQLLVKFEPSYPQVEGVKQQIDALDRSIAVEEARITSARRSDYQQTRDRELELQRRVTALKSKFDTQQRDRIQYNIYKREADTNRQLYNEFLQRYREIGVAGVGSNNIVIVDKAEVPEKPSSPNLLLNGLLALTAGLGLAAATLVALEQVDESIRDPSQVAINLGLPLLGTTPAINEGDVLEQLHDVRSDILEAYISIASSLALASSQGVPKALMLTSTRPAEGKSTSSVALAAVLGHLGKRVLLIDVDLRHPSLHEYFSASRNPGMSNLLTGDNNWEEMVQQTDFTNVDLLSAGRKPPSAATLFNGDRLIDLVNRMSGRYDHVVLDAPPVLGLADAPLLSKAVFGTIYVVEAAGVSSRGINEAIGRLRSANAAMLGIIFTKYKEERSDYGYGYGYGRDSD